METVASDSSFIDVETAFAGIDFGTANIGACFALVIVGLLSILTGIVALVVSTVVAFACALQIYVMVTSIPGTSGGEYAADSIINFTGGSSVTDSLGSILRIVTWVSTSVLLIIGLAKSGARTKKILGG